MKEKLTSIRLSSEIQDEIEKISKRKDTDKSKLIRELILLGIKELKIEESLSLYQQGKISLWKAARLADISLWEMIEIVSERRIPAQYTERELKKDLKALSE